MVCYHAYEFHRCQFCAFSKGKTEEDLRGLPYVVPLEEITRRTAEAWSRGATEVCMQVHDLVLHADKACRYVIWYYKACRYVIWYYKACRYIIWYYMLIKHAGLGDTGYKA
jgi:2-iminoacetate synthase ThiH